MEKKGKFLLMDLGEFDGWLLDNRFCRSVRILQNHHTFIPAYTHFRGDNHFQLLAGMERTHMADRGFSEIAQNLTTFPDGRVAVCRAFDKVPAGIRGANQEGLCIEHVGNFDAGRDAMTAAHRDAIVRVNALLCREFSLTPSLESIVYHHWYDLNSGKRTGGAGTTKTCPGTAFFGGNREADAAREFIPLVAALTALAAGGAPSVPLWTAEVTASSLNVRTGRGTGFAVVKSLARGVRVNVFAEAEGWARIHPTEEQWVAVRYLKGS